MSLENIKWLIIAGLIAVIIFQRSCSNCPKSNEVVKAVPGDTKFVKGKDSLVEIKKYYPVDHEVAKPYPVRADSFPYYLKVKLTHADSLKVVQAFFTAKIYKDTINGSQCLVAIKDSVAMNNLYRLSAEIKNTRPQAVVQQNRNKVFFGGSIGVGIDLKSIAVIPQATLITKNDNYYQIGFDVISRSAQVGMEWKIKFK